MLTYTSGFKCQCPNIFRLAIARPTREIVYQYVVYRNEDLRHEHLTNITINSYTISVSRLTTELFPE